ncbi:tRNA-splicing endonuclease subunit [Trifolium repens]|nr:tRNA-splicing endonuclease subunit [Trifolium repens]
MEEKVCLCSSNKDSDNDDDEVYLQNASDEEDFQFSPGSSTKLQFRNTKSKGRWNEEMGMAELFEKNGKMWVTTGIVRNGKIYTSIEETLYLMELEAFDLLDNDDRSISLSEMYEKVAGGKFGCCWELFEAYRHLKSLGYIIARHDVAWSLKSIRSSLKSSDLEGVEENKQLVDMVSKVEVSIDKLFGELKINDLKPNFDVYLPNNRFRKSFPGDPNFLLYLSRGHPPSKAEIELLERQCGGIPLKFCLVAEGRVSFFSFDKVELPVIP